MKSYLYLLVTLFLIQSCDDQLDVTPQDVLDSDIAITSLDDLNGALNGAYAALRSSGLYRESMLWLPDLLGDNIRIGNSNGGALRTEANWQFTSANDIDTWQDAYTLIFRANTVINNVDAYEDGPKKNRILGQALALRALGHFDLLRYYGADYDRNSTAMGVPIVLQFELDKPSRNSVKEVYDQIYDDLLTARVALGNVDQVIQANGPYYFDQSAVDALLARVSLYAKQWQDAADYASAVIGKKELATRDQYSAIWSEDVAYEILFSVAFATPDEGRIAADLLNNTNPNAPIARFTLTHDTANLYDADNDVRYTSFVLLNPLNLPGTNDANDDVYLINKYPGKDGQYGYNNAKVLRVSEMYLIRAEARTHLNDGAGALADLNTLRSHRINGYVIEDLSGQALEEAIQIERRKELVAEGHRWFDLRRNGQGVVRGSDCRGLTINCNLNAGNFRFVYPIPQEEIFSNKNMAQNPGY